MIAPASAAKNSTARIKRGSNIHTCPYPFIGHVLDIIPWI
jgi:hypothetical protein